MFNQTKTDTMNWIYNTLPDTHRYVLVAFRAPELLETENVQYTVASLDRRKEAFVLSDQYEVIAWTDFPRISKDANGEAVTHSWLTVEGLKS